MFHSTQQGDGFMETAGFMAESVEKIFHLAEQVLTVILGLYDTLWKRSYQTEVKPIIFQSVYDKKIVMPRTSS